MHAFLHGLFPPHCDKNLTLQILPVCCLRECSFHCFPFREPFSTKYFIGFLQVRGELGMDFVPLCGIQSKAGEALTDEFLPIRHQPPW